MTKHKGNHGREGAFICNKTHAYIFTELLPRVSRLIQHLY